MYLKYHDDTVPVPYSCYSIEANCTVIVHTAAVVPTANFVLFFRTIIIFKRREQHAQLRFVALQKILEVITKLHIQPASVYST